MTHAVLMKNQAGTSQESEVLKPAMVENEEQYSQCCEYRYD